MRALHGLAHHFAEGLRDARIGERLGQMVLVAEDEVQREDAGLRRHRRGVGGRRDDEVDVARAHLLQHLRFLAELRAGELVDAETAAAQFLELGVEDVAGDAVGGAGRLVVGEAEGAVLGDRTGRPADRRRRQGSRKCIPSVEQIHPQFPPFWARLRAFVRVAGSLRGQP